MLLSKNKQRLLPTRTSADIPQLSFLRAQPAANHMKFSRSKDRRKTIPMLVTWPPMLSVWETREHASNVSLLPKENTVIKHLSPMSSTHTQHVSDTEWYRRYVLNRDKSHLIIHLKASTVKSNNRFMLPENEIGCSYHHIFLSNHQEITELIVTINQILIIYSTDIVSSWMPHPTMGKQRELFVSIWKKTYIFILKNLKLEIKLTINSDL